MPILMFSRLCGDIAYHARFFLSLFPTGKELIRFLLRTIHA